MDSFIRYALLLTAAVTVAAAGLRAESSLVRNSPFVPRGYGQQQQEQEVPVQQAPTPSVLDFSGFGQMEGTWKFSLVDKRNGRFYWIPLGDEQAGIEIIDFDERTYVLTVRNQGRVERLKLRQASGTPVPIAQAEPTPNQQNATSNASTGNERSESRIPRRRIIIPRRGGNN